MYNDVYIPRQPYHLGAYHLGCASNRLTNTSDVGQGMCDTLKVPITIISDADITHCETLWMGQQRHRVPQATWRERTEQGAAFTDLMKRNIFPVRFQDATPSKCKVTCMWYDGINRASTYVTFDGDKYP